MQKALERQCYESSIELVLKPEASQLSLESLEGWCLLGTDVTKGEVGCH